MANKKDGFLQKAKRQMEKKGTIGAFTDYCGGKVTDQCIERAMNSNNDTLRRRAQFAKNVRAQSGLMNEKPNPAKQDSVIKASQFPSTMMGPNVAPTNLPDTSMQGMPMDPNIMKNTIPPSESKIKKFQDGGTKQLPGGIMKPIGYGAFKFHGNKHDEAGLGSDSGIILEEGGKKEPGLEVEDGELQVDVDTAEGEKEYIVSDYIKNPTTGNTLAEDLEKELKRAKNNMEAAKITARYVRLNEELRGSDGDPSKIKAQEGQFAEDRERAQEGTGILDEESGKPYEGGALTEKESKIGEQSVTDEDLFGEATLEGFKGTMKDNPWFDWENFDPTKKEDVKKFQEEYNERAPEGEKLKVDGKFGTQTQSARLFKPVDKMEPLQAKIDSPELETPTIQGEDKYKKTEEPAPAAEAEGEAAKFRPRMTGTTLQALGPLAALSKDVTAKSMAPAYAKEIRMGRVNLDPERAAAAQQTQAGSAGITSGLAGPAAFAMQQKNLAAGQQSQRGITDQENRANIQIAGQEKGTNVGIRRSNQQASMAAGQFNVGEQNKAQAMNVQKDINAMNQLGKIGTQTVKDYNEQYANFGSDMMQYGAPAADYYANVYKGNTPFGMGSRDIKVVNDQASKVEEAFKPKEEEARKGRYIKKSNKVRRKKRRK